MPDKFENATVRAKTEQMFCIHTRAFLGGCLHSIFGSFSLKTVLSCHSKVSSPFIKDNNSVNEIVPPRTRSAKSNPEASLLVRPIAWCCFYSILILAITA